MFSPRPVMADGGRNTVVSLQVFRLYSHDWHKPRQPSPDRFRPLCNGRPVESIDHFKGRVAVLPSYDWLSVSIVVDRVLKQSHLRGCYTVWVVVVGMHAIS